MRRQGYPYPIGPVGPHGGANAEVFKHQWREEMLRAAAKYENFADRTLLPVVQRHYQAVADRARQAAFSPVPSWYLAGRPASKPWQRANVAVDNPAGEMQQARWRTDARSLDDTRASLGLGAYDLARQQGISFAHGLLPPGPARTGVTALAATALPDLTGAYDQGAQSYLDRVVAPEAEGYYELLRQVLNILPRGGRG